MIQVLVAAIETDQQLNTAECESTWGWWRGREEAAAREGQGEARVLFPTVATDVFQINFALSI